MLILFAAVWKREKIIGCDMAISIDVYYLFVFQQTISLYLKQNND